MQLVVVTPHFWSEVGVGNAAMALTQELVKIGVDLVSVIHGESYTRSYLNNTHGPIQNISIALKETLFLKPFRRYLLSMRAADALKSLQNKIGDDCVVHNHSLFPNAFLGNGNKNINASFVTTIHGTYSGERDRFTKEPLMCPQDLRYRLSTYMHSLLLKKLERPYKSHVIALSPENVQRFRDDGIFRSNVHLIPNGVDLNFFKPYDQYEARKQLGLPTEKLIVSTICNIEPRKGLHLLIKAAHSVIREEPNAYFVIVGRVSKANRWYLSYLNNLVDQLGLNKVIKFVGFVPTAELPLYLNASDVFVLASYGEGAPLVIPQAMACRRIVIATEGAEAGYLPPSLVAQNGNFEDLAQKISFYLSNSKERKLRSNELYEKAKNELSWANIARRTFNLYQKILEN